MDIDRISERGLASYRAGRIALAYAGFSALWILFSDKTLLFTVRNVETLTVIQSIKGWLFVTASAGLLFFFLQREINRHLRTQEQFQAIFDHHYQLTGLLTPEGILVQANPAALQFIGADRQVYQGQYFWDTPWWNHSADLQERLKTAIQEAREGHFVRFEATHPGPEGKKHLFDFSINPVFNEEGKVVYLVPEGRDISALKKYESALVESQTLYREAQKIAQIGHWKLNLPDRKLEWSDELYNIFEVDRENVGASFETFMDLVHPEDQEDLVKVFRSSIEQKKPYKAEHRILLPDGRIKFIHETGRTEYDEDGNPLVSIGAAQDVTEKKIAEQQLLFTQHSVEYGATPILWIGENQEIHYLNRAASTLLGFEKDELIGQLEPLLHPDVAEKYWKKCIHLLKKDRIITDEAKLRKKDGSTFPALITCSFVEFMGQGNFVLNLLDLTQIKKTEDKLRQAQKMEAIGTLAGGIAHDFNNILSGVIGYTEIALDDQLPAESPARRSLEQVLVAAYRARDLVKQIQTFSRQSDNKVIHLNLALMVKEVLKLMRATMPATIDMQQKLSGKCFDIVGDSTQIHQILTNLCTNAAYAMNQKGGGVLMVSLESGAFQFTDGMRPEEIKGPRPCVTLIVADTGTGIATPVMEKIFDPFFTTKPKEEGTGLGLSVVHGIVKEHGGEIIVESRQGIGASFTIHFPMAVKSSEQESDGDEPLPGGSEAILLVDDEEVNVNIYKTTLESLGYSVMTTTSSREALEIFRSSPGKFDLVFSDLTMPELTGDRLAQAIHLIQPDQAIVLCTGFPQELSERKLEEMGISKLMTKPLSKRQLAVGVRNTLNQNKG